MPDVIGVINVALKATPNSVEDTVSVTIDEAIKERLIKVIAADINDDNRFQRDRFWNSIEFSRPLVKNFIAETYSPFFFLFHIELLKEGTASWTSSRSDYMSILNLLRSEDCRRFFQALEEYGDRHAEVVLTFQGED